LEQALRLLHPFMPFITEELWQRLPGVGAHSLHAAYAGAEPTVMLAAYPHGAQELIDEQSEAEMQSVIELISRVRSIRSEMNIKPSEEVELIIGASGDSSARVFDASMTQIKRLARARRVNFTSTMSDVPRHSARAVLAGGVEVALPLEGLIDFEQERARVEKEREKLRKEAERLEAQLSNPQFTERAPAEKVAELRQRVADIAQRMKALEQTLEALA